MKKKIEALNELDKDIHSESKKNPTKSEEELFNLKTYLIDALYNTKTDRTALKKKIIIDVNAANNFSSLTELLQRFIMNPGSSCFFNSWANSRLNQQLQILLKSVIRHCSTLYEDKTNKLIKSEFRKFYPTYDKDVDTNIEIALSNSIARSKQEQLSTSYYINRFENFMEELSLNEDKLDNAKLSLLNLRINQIRLIYEYIISNTQKIIIQSSFKFNEFDIQKSYEPISFYEEKNETHLHDALKYALEYHDYNQQYENREIMLIIRVGMYLIKNQLSEYQDWILDKIILLTESKLKREDIIRMAKSQLETEEQFDKGFSIQLSLS